MHYVTYTELFAFGMFVIALISLVSRTKK
ncbi:MAG: putative holin-like toxin [Butyricicoccaceae bacterium]